MTVVFLGVGSNHERVQNLTQGIALLQQQFAGIAYSPVYESKPLGEAKMPYYNLVVRLETDRSASQLKAMLKEIEAACGRVRDGSGRCALDMDILFFGDAAGVVDALVLPHEDVLQRSYVLRPLAELAPAWMHPVVKKNMQQLWQDFSGDKTLRTLSFRPDSALRPPQ